MERRRSAGGFQSLPEVEGTGRLRPRQADHPGGYAKGGEHLQLFAVDPNGEAALGAQRRDHALEEEPRQSGLGDFALRELSQAHEALELGCQSLLLREAALEALQEKRVLEGVGDLGGGLQDYLVAWPRPCGLARAKRQEAPRFIASAQGDDEPGVEAFPFFAPFRGIVESTSLDGG